MVPRKLTSLPLSGAAMSMGIAKFPSSLLPDQGRVPMVRPSRVLALSVPLAPLIRVDCALDGKLQYDERSEGIEATGCDP